MTRPNRSKFKSLYLWHRHFGLFSAVFIILLAVTGLFLQHSDVLSLDKRYISNKALLNWYGITANPITSYSTENHWISHAGDFLYLDGNAIGHSNTELKGAIETASGIIVINSSHLFWFDKSGQLIETLSNDSSLPDAPTHIAYNKPYVIMQGLERAWQIDQDLLSWQHYQGQTPQWSSKQNASDELIRKVAQHNISHEINLERVLLDLHSGRLFGVAGPYLMDLAAIAMLFLAGTGITVWLQRRKKDKLHQKTNH